MSVVFRAEHPELGRHAAIKVLNPEVSGLAAVKTRFLDEARILARIQHPNVISIFDFGRTSRDELYYVMELLAGPAARRCLERRGDDPGAGLALPRADLRGLQAVHDHGVVHRDLKPANIFVLEGKPLAVKLLDFGIAKLFEPALRACTRPRRAWCSARPRPSRPSRPPAAATESAREPTSTRWAWSSTGCSPAQPPFDDAPPAVLMAKHINATRPAGSSGPVPRAIEELVHRCLAKSPADRPASANEIAAAYAPRWEEPPAPSSSPAAPRPARRDAGASPLLREREP